MNNRNLFYIVLLSFALTVSSIGGCMYGYPHYTVYEQRLTGESELARAEYARQVQVRDAQAKRDSAIMLAEAEVERAKGVAQANKIIGDSLKDNSGYLQYLWINKLDAAAGKGQIIYVPTEGNIPIMEAGRGLGSAQK